MRVIPFGAAKTVTGSCYSLKIKSDNVLIDCGMFQGSKKLTKKNYDFFKFDVKSHKNLLLTHAHLDHCGRIPKLIKEGFKGKIYATSATRDLAEVVMLDSAKIAKHDTVYENRRRVEAGLPPREPIYTEDDVRNAMKMFVNVDYRKPQKITENLTCTFHDAGHILGASFLELDVKDEDGKKIVVFSGDLGNPGVPILKETEILSKADYVFIESTYGDRLHGKMEDRKNKFINIIRETYDAGGKLLIPSFAIERAQELVYDLDEFAEKNMLPKMKVYIDSPMAIKATEVFKKHSECFNKELKEQLQRGDNPFSFPGLVYSNTVEDSKAILENKGPCIIIAGSGMCTGGRIKHHIKHFIEDPRTTLLFVGYQVEGTLGYWIKRGEKRIRLLGRERDVNARIEDIDSFSGHADYLGLLSWLRHFKPKKVFVVHGDPAASISFSNKVNKELNMETSIPSIEEEISI